MHWTLLFMLVGLLGWTKPTRPLSDESSVVAGLQAQLKKLEAQPLSIDQKARAARLLYYLGKFTKEETQKVAYWERGLALAKEAKEGQPKHSAAILWWTANQGELAQRNKLSALHHVKKIHEALLELKQNDPALEHYAPLRALGRLYHQAPSFISVGDNDKAREHFELALAKAAYCPGNKALFADFLFDQGEKEQARKLALEAIETADPKKFTPEQLLDWTTVAKKVLERLG